MITRSVLAGELKPGMQIILGEHGGGLPLWALRRRVVRVRFMSFSGCVEIMHGRTDHPGELDYWFRHSTAVVRAATS